MNKRIITLLLVLIFTQIQVSVFGQKKIKSQPNVIIVITDDQGYGDLGCHGNDLIRTPNIDEFYNESSRLTNFHVSPTCAPTRASLMTGRFANRVGVWHTIAGRSILWDDETTMSEVFKENGYTTGLFGKWHLGDNYPSRPKDRGFDEVLVHGGGGITQGPDFWANDYFDDTYRYNGSYKKFEGYCTDVYFDTALDFIDKNKEAPFFCYISTNAPHGPLNVPAKYHEIYKDEQNLTEKQRRFYGMITNIDDNFSRLRKKLKDLDIEDNTILVFMTDNGTAGGAEVINGKMYGNNGGMRGAKNSEYEGGHRVPFFIRWPDGKLTEGKDISTLTAHIDILPSLIDLCELKNVTEHKPFDGKSIKALLYNEESNLNERTLVVDSQRRRNLVKWRKSAVIDGDWRLVNKNQLYNLVNDPMQRKNISKEYPEITLKLQKEYNNWWNSIIEEGVNERYAYIKAGSKAENPVRISAHDMHTESTLAHSQVGSLLGLNPLGIFKIEIIEEGDYTVSLCRYPRESGYTFNQEIPEIKANFEIEKGMPASKKLNFIQADLSIEQYDKKSDVNMNDKEVNFKLYLQKGKYDLDAFFTDENNVKYPPYYIYIEKNDLTF
jgi:arylsulfatase A-like enzyme